MHCWDIVAWEEKMEGGTSLELVLSAAKTGIKTVFHFWRLSPKCHTKFVAAAVAQLHSNLPLLHPCSSSLTWQSFFHLLPALSTLSNCCHLKAKRTMRAKYTWNMFGSTFKRKLLLLSLPTAFPLSLSVSFMVNKNCVVSLHKRLQISKLFDKFYCQNNFPQKFLMLLKFSFQESLFCVKLRIFVGRKLWKIYLCLNKSKQREIAVWKDRKKRKL